MKIEFLEQDSELNAVIAVINGQRKILSLSKTIKDVIEMPGIPVVDHQQTELSVKAFTDTANELMKMSVEGRSSYPKEESTDIQREDLVKVVNIAKGLSDTAGNELVTRYGLVNGNIYRVLKVNATNIVMPNDPDKMTKIINSLEIIDDQAPRPERIAVFPNEVVLYKKRDKKQSVVVNKISELLKCPYCGETNALILEGDIFKGKCSKCDAAIEIERITEQCPNEKCFDANKLRNKVALYRYNGSYVGQCGVCKTQAEKKAQKS